MEPCIIKDSDGRYRVEGFDGWATYDGLVWLNSLLEDAIEHALQEAE